MFSNEGSGSLIRPSSYHCLYFCYLPGNRYFRMIEVYNRWIYDIIQEILISGKTDVGSFSSRCHIRPRKGSSEGAIFEIESILAFVDSALAVHAGARQLPPSRPFPKFSPLHFLPYRSFVVCSLMFSKCIGVVSKTGKSSRQQFEHPKGVSDVAEARSTESRCPSRR